MSTPPAGPDDGLFPGLAPTVTTAPRAASGPEWERVHTTVRCDACRRSLAAAHGRGLLPAPARWRHHTPTGTVLLCYGHAREQREGGAQ